MTTTNAYRANDTVLRFEVAGEIHDCLVLALDELDAGEIDLERAKTVMAYLRPAMGLTRQAVEVLS